MAPITNEMTGKLDRALLGLFFFSLMMGAVAVLITDRLWTAFIFIAPGALAPSMVWYRDNVRTPRSIEIADDGVNTSYRSGKTRFIPWEDFAAIYYRAGDSSKRGSAKGPIGHYRLKNGGAPYMLYGDLAKEVREAYARRTGKYLPMR